MSTAAAIEIGAIRFNMVYFLSGSHQQHGPIWGTSGTGIGCKTRKIKKIVTTGIFSHESPYSRSLRRWFSPGANPAILHAHLAVEVT
jgi:hypothetical protein